MSFLRTDIADRAVGVHMLLPEDAAGAGYFLVAEGDAGLRVLAFVLEAAGFGAAGLLRVFGTGGMASTSAGSMCRACSIM